MSKKTKRSTQHKVKFTDPPQTQQSDIEDYEARERELKALEKLQADKKHFEYLINSANVRKKIALPLCTIAFAITGVALASFIVPSSVFFAIVFAVTTTIVGTTIGKGLEKLNDNLSKRLHEDVKRIDNKIHELEETINESKNHSKSEDIKVNKTTPKKEHEAQDKSEEKDKKQKAVRKRPIYVGRQKVGDEWSYSDDSSHSSESAERTERTYIQAIRDEDSSYSYSDSYSDYSESYSEKENARSEKRNSQSKTGSARG